MIPQRRDRLPTPLFLGFPRSSVGKESACSIGDPGSIPGSGGAPGEGNGNPLQYSCLENPMDRGAWRGTVHRVARVGHDLATKPPPSINLCQKVHLYILGFPCDSAGKESACNVGDLGLIPGLGRSPAEGKGYPLQHSGLENSMDCIAHGVATSQTRLSDFHFHGRKDEFSDARG